MPLYDDRKPLHEQPYSYSPVAIPTTHRATPPPKLELPDATWYEGAEAAVKLENDIWNAVQYFNRENFGDFDPGHNPLDVIEGTEYDNFRDAFVGSRNLRETMAIMKQVDDERQWRETLERSGLWGYVAPMISAVISPTTALPVGAAYVRGAAKVGTALMRAGKSAAVIGGANAAAAALQEAVLQQNQVTRTMLESLLNVGFAGVLGGAFGAGWSGMRSSAAFRQDALMKAFGGYDTAIARQIEERLGIYGGGVGADVSNRLPPLKLESTGGIAEATVRLGPAAPDDLRVFVGSPSPVTREIMAQIADPLLYFTRNRDGIPASPRGGTIETRIKTQGIALEGRATRIAEEAYMEYYFGAPVGRARRAASGAAQLVGMGKAGKLTESQFFAEAGRSAVRGDTHEIPEVAKAAKAFREELFDPVANRAVALGYLNEEIVNKMRPKSSKTSGGAKPTPREIPKVDMSGPKAAAARDLINQWREVTGGKLPMDINDLVREIAADDDLMNRLRRTLRGDDLQFSVDAETGRLVRTDETDVGQDWNRLVDDLEAGKTVNIDPVVVEKMMDEVVEVQAEMPNSVRDTPTFVLTRAEPIDGGKVRLNFHEAWGADRRSVVLRPDQVRNFRAFHFGGNIFLRASTLGNRVGGVPNRKLLGGQIWHEFVHARLHQGPEVVIGGGGEESFHSVFQRIAVHGADLGYMDESIGSFMRKIDDPSAYSAADEVIDSSPRLLDVYDDMYSSPEYGGNLDLKIAEEVVAHMMELRSHGLLRDDVELAPILDDLKAIFGDDLPPQRLTGVADDVEQISTAFDNINVFAGRGDVDPDLLKSAALRSFVDVMPDDPRLANQVVELELDDLEAGRIQVEMPAGEAFRMIDQRLKGINQLIGCLS